jgi:hypothetical protein
MTPRRVALHVLFGVAEAAYGFHVWLMRLAYRLDPSGDFDEHFPR